MIMTKIYSDAALQIVNPSFQYAFSSNERDGMQIFKTDIFRDFSEQLQDHAHMIAYTLIYSTYRQGNPPHVRWQLDGFYGHYGRLPTCDDKLSICFYGDRFFKFICSNGLAPSFLLTECKLYFID